MNKVYQNVFFISFSFLHQRRGFSLTKHLFKKKGLFKYFGQCMKCQKYNFTDLLLPQLVKLLNPIPARVLENQETPPPPLNPMFYVQI